MRAALDIIKFCGWFGIMGLCAILIITGILRWLASKADRKRRLNILGWAAFAMLGIIFLVHYEMAGLQGNENSNRISFPVFFNVVKDGIGLLAFGLIVFSVIILIFIVALCLYKGVRILFLAKSDTEDIRKELERANQRNNAFSTAVKNPLVILVITLGIIALFLIFPLLVGEQEGKGVLESWENGIYIIDKFVDPKPLTELSQALPIYMMIYLVVLGVGFAIIQILYSIINHTFEKCNGGTFIDEYANPIGLLSVGVALLLEISKGSLLDKSNDKIEVIGQLVGTFVSVVFIIAIVILTLELVRLLMDMKETLIRKEAKLLFIALVGQSALLLMEILRSVYSGANSITGNVENSGLSQIQERLKGKIIQEMDEEIENKKSYKMTFLGFDEKITKK